MKRKDYMKPAMRVVKIQHTGMLMTSGFGANRNGYGDAIEQTWGDSPASPFVDLPGLDVLNILPKE